MMNWHVDDGGDADDDDNWSCYLKIRGELCASVLLQFPELGFRSSKELGNSLVFEAHITHTLCFLFPPLLLDGQRGSHQQRRGR
ncbi:uncharacterized protein LOC141642162 isoform X5 [Silene latifolia]|uniref:uncharacterized protein LOC141642162 isoform X5 n=1 Tax=Silene latifolia TaxID=37657 RepID=UPI003D777557